MLDFPAMEGTGSQKRSSKKPRHREKTRLPLQPKGAFLSASGQTLSLNRTVGPIVIGGTGFTQCQFSRVPKNRKRASRKPGIHLPKADPTPGLQDAASLEFQVSERLPPARYRYPSSQASPFDAAHFQPLRLLKDPGQELSAAIGTKPEYVMVLVIRRTEI